MKKNLFKVLSLALVALMAMTCVASAASVAGEYADGTVTATVTGVGTTDEVTILVVPHGTDLATVEADDIIYIDQVTAAEGTATFSFASSTEEIDIYSGYTSMDVAQGALSLIYSGAAEDIIYGDIDGNGSISLNDVSTTLAVFLETITATDAQITTADVDGNKSITLNDVSLILSKFLDDTVKFPVEQ